MSLSLRPLTLRNSFQAVFLLFYLYLGLRFNHWVELLRSGSLPSFPRPAAVDGFLPISGLAGLRLWLEGGDLNPIHPAAVLIFVAALATALLLKRGFCAWICPVFTLSEPLWRLGRRLFGRNFAPPFWLDLPLRGLKYLLLGFFLWQLLWGMPLAGLRQFLYAPYHKLADVRMLEFFLQPSALLLGVLAFLTLASLFVQMPWCRYLCPYGALLGIFSLLSPSRIARREAHCIRCGHCSNRCPAWLPVMQKKQIRSSECYACLHCVSNCPAPEALALTWGGKWNIPPWLFALLLVSCFLLADLYGRLSGHWIGSVSPQEIMNLLRLARP
ncbi:MAG: 4Fe-4S binding protein [Desulfuromonas sp.]|nr:MAG: 4Fe-4S binding protein [Desulfuromonas sp.]